MTDFESQHELDDELLSAYLDGELSAEERAAVEARLAADPAAEQLLHQLRAVSQGMQSLPQKVVGADLRESILRKAEQQSEAAGKALGVSSEEGGSASAIPADAGPTLTIGRTRRGWMWASLAVAAALLLIVFQSEPQQVSDLPAVAKRDAPAAKEKMPLGRSDEDALAFRSLREPTAPAAAPAIADREPSQGMRQLRNWSLADGETTGAPAPGAVSGLDRRAGLESETAGVQLGQSNQPNDAFGVHDRYSAAAVHERSATEPLDVGQTGTLSDELLDAMPSSEIEPLREAHGNLAEVPSPEKQVTAAEKEQTEGKELLVVRVVAKRAALEGKAFDRLLERNGIAIEAEAAPDNVEQRHAFRSADRVAQEDKDEFGDSLATAGAPAEIVNEEADSLLVHASEAAIQSCLENLHEDTTNYVAVAVDDAITAEDVSGQANLRYEYFVDVKDTSSQKLAERLGWTKYGRGNLPQQREWLDRSKLSSLYQREAEHNDMARGGGVGGSYSEAITLDESKRESEVFSKKIAGEANQGRARRVRSLDVDASRRGSSVASRETTPRGEAAVATERRQSAEVRLQLGTPLQTEADAGTLPVLFVLMPEEEAKPSPATENRAE